MSEFIKNKIDQKVKIMMEDYYTNPGEKAINNKAAIMRDIRATPEQILQALNRWHADPDNSHFPTSSKIKNIIQENSGGNKDSYYNRNKWAWLLANVIDLQDPNELERVKKSKESHTTMPAAWLGFFQFLTQDEKKRFNIGRVKMGLKPFKEYTNSTNKTTAAEKEKIYNTRLQNIDF